MVIKNLLCRKYEIERRRSFENIKHYQFENKDLAKLILQ